MAAIIPLDPLAGRASDRLVFQCAKLLSPQTWYWYNRRRAVTPDELRTKLLRHARIRRAVLRQSPHPSRIVCVTELVTATFAAGHVPVANPTSKSAPVIGCFADVAYRASVIAKAVNSMSNRQLPEVSRFRIIEQLQYFRSAKRHKHNSDTQRVRRAPISTIASRPRRLKST